VGRIVPQLLAHNPLLDFIRNDAKLALCAQKPPASGGREKLIKRGERPPDQYKRGERPLIALIQIIMTRSLVGAAAGDPQLTTHWTPPVPTSDRMRLRQQCIVSLGWAQQDRQLLSSREAFSVRHAVSDQKETCKTSPSDA